MSLRLYILAPAAWRFGPFSSKRNVSNARLGLGRRMLADPIFRAEPPGSFLELRTKSDATCPRPRWGARQTWV